MAEKQNIDPPLSLTEDSDETANASCTKNNLADSTKIEDDKELDDLLDSALEDFDKAPPAPQVPAVTKETASAVQDSGNLSTQQILEQSASQPADGADLSSQQEALFNEIFQAAGSENPQDMGQMEEFMRQFMSQQPGLMEQLGQMEQATDLGVPPEGSSSFEDTLQQTMGSLAQNAQELQSEATDADLMRMLSGMSGMGLDDTEAGEGSDLDFLPMMQGMMKSLMSKEVLYPSLKDITDKYPAWFDANSSSVSETELTKYKKQYTLMKQIVTDFEEEKPEDPDHVKTARFQKILDTMQNMQELGQPPKDLVGELPAGMELDENGLPKMLPNAEQCSVM